MEEYDQCPQYSNETAYARFWTNPTSSSSDYFNSCANSYSNIVGVPFNQNQIGYQPARTGNAYMGMVMNGPGLPVETVREYIQGTLSCPLIKGFKYHVEFYANLENQCPMATSTIGVYFTSYLMDTVSLNLFGCIPQIQNEPANIISDTLNWIRVSGDFTANGGERYFTIGNFFPDINSIIDTVDVAIPNVSDDVGYYYVDDVSVMLADTVGYSFMAPDVFTPNGDAINDTFTVNTDNVLDMTLHICDRWGREVYSFTGLNPKWDGEISGGNPAEEGVYFYVAMLVVADCEIQNKSGFFHLFR